MGVPLLLALAVHRIPVPLLHPPAQASPSRALDWKKKYFWQGTNLAIPHTLSGHYEPAGDSLWQGQLRVHSGPQVGRLLMRK